MTSLLVALTLTLGAYRLTRLFIQDEVLDRPRDYLFSKTKPGRPLYTLLTCYWCLGFWISLSVVLLFLAFPVVMPWILAPFAISAVVGIIDQKVS